MTSILCRRPLRLFLATVAMICSADQRWAQADVVITLSDVIILPGGTASMDVSIASADPTAEAFNIFYLDF